MQPFSQPRLVVSKCLGFDNCRYNGARIDDPFVQTLQDFVEFIPVCPEVEIGLGIPRKPIRLINTPEGKVVFQPATQKQYTSKMKNFCEQFLDSLPPVDGFLLKNRSPSCGISDVKVYHKFTPDSAALRGKGIFGELVQDRFEGLAIEDEGRLKNFHLREYFLTRLYALADFRQVKAQASMSALIEFHAKNKLLFLAHKESVLREMGRIVANHAKLPLSVVLAAYTDKLHALLRAQPRYSAWINVLQHAFGGVSGQLSTEERQFFSNTIEEYRDERIPLSVLLKLIHAWVVRFENDYLLQQRFLNPFPRELVEVTDSGKGKMR